MQCCVIYAIAAAAKLGNFGNYYFSFVTDKMDILYLLLKCDHQIHNIDIDITFVAAIFLAQQFLVHGLAVPTIKSGQAMACRRLVFNVAMASIQTETVAFVDFASFTFEAIEAFTLRQTS